MPLITLPIRKPTYNVEPEAKVLVIDEARDCHYENVGDGKYCIRRRPGRSLFSNINETAVYSNGLLKTGQGLFWSDRLAAAFAVANGKLFKIDSTGTPTQLTGATLNTITRVIFAEAQDLSLNPFIYLAHGGTLRYTNGTTLSTPSDAGVPTAATFVASLNNRIIANNGGQDFLITATNPATGFLDPFYWSMTGNPWRAALKADVLKALHTAWTEICLWGTQSIEYWQEDGTTPISPLVGATTEAGIEAEYSIVQADDAWFALCTLGGQFNTKRSVIRLQNHSVQITSNDIDRELQDMTTVSDANGFLCFVGGLNLYVLCFPTAGQTWAYDIKEKMWIRWGAWNSPFSRYDMFPAVASCYAKAWNKHLVQGTDGNVYTFNRDLYKDSDSTIRTLIRTGWIDHGTWRRKRSNRLLIKVKAYRPGDAKFLVRWRDDGRPEWGNYQEISLKSTDEQTHNSTLTQMGMYTTRQYEFMMTDDADLALMGLQEDVTELRN